MLSSRLIARCPSAKAIDHGVAQGWDLEFSKKSIDGSGKATLITNAEAIHTPGVLFEVNVRELNDLDRFEGAGKGYDRLDDFEIETSKGSVKAVTYLASERHSNMIPFDWYLALIVAGVLEHKLADGHADNLRKTTRKPDLKLTRKSRIAALEALSRHDHVDYLALLES